MSKQKSEFKLHLDDEIVKLLPPLNEKTAFALKEDIRKRGIQVPLVVSEDDGTVVCGCNRFSIAEALNYTIPEDKIEKKKFSCRMEMIDFAIKDNLLRRHLTTWQKCILIKNVKDIATQIAKENQIQASHSTALTSNKGRSGRKSDFERKLKNKQSNI